MMWVMLGTHALKKALVVSVGSIVTTLHQLVWRWWRKLLMVLLAYPKYFLLSFDAVHNL